MIDQDSIKRKDFSIELSLLIKQLSFVADSLQFIDDEKIPLEKEFIEGAGMVIQDITNDLKIIDHTLYQAEKTE